MGRPWRDHPAWAVVTTAEAATGENLAHLLLDAPAELLERTREAQLAVLLQSLMAWEAVRDDIDTPVAFAGHSLGQVTALIAAGVLPLHEGVRLAAARAGATQRAADKSPGRMVALVGADLAVAENACEGNDEAWVANDNAPGQVVLGGTPDGVEAASDRARSLGVRRVVPLNVGGAFHTPLMAPARDELLARLESTTFSAPIAPVVSNLDAAAHTDPGEWPHQLADHLVSPVRWRPTLQTLSELGAVELVEVGPGNVLATLARRTLPGVAVRNISVPDDIGVPPDVAAPLEVA